MTGVIRCAGLTKRYRGVTALDRLDLTVEPGQVFGFLGPNGAGKTTTLRILLGLVTPSAGRAWLNGRRIPDPDGLSRVGAMIEEPAFYPWLTGRRNLAVLALSGAPLPGPGDAVAEVLDRVGLTGAADRKVKGYSQGMRQRLGLAAALMRKPTLLLLDEPANGLDPAGIAEFRTLMRSLADEGTTVFLSSHLLAEVEQVCDQVAVVSSGRLVEQGPVASLAAGRPRVRAVLDPADQQTALTLLSPWAVRADGPDAVLIDGANGQAVTRALGQGGVWPHQVALTRPALEQTFLTLTEPSCSRTFHAGGDRRPEQTRQKRPCQREKWARGSTGRGSTGRGSTGRGSTGRGSTGRGSTGQGRTPPDHGSGAGGGHGAAGPERGPAP